MGKLARCGLLSQPQGHGHLCLDDFTTLSRQANLSPPPHDLHAIAALSRSLVSLVFPLRCLYPSLKVGSVLIGALLPFHSLFRWGQAIAVVNEALFVFGGKTDPYNSYGYTSAPWNNDLPLPFPLHTVRSLCSTMAVYLGFSEHLRFIPREPPCLAYPLRTQRLLPPRFRWQHGSPFQHRPARQ